MSHFSKSISQTMTFWELGLGLFGIRVILRGKLGFYGRSKVLEKLSWRTGTQPLEGSGKYVLLAHALTG